MSVEIAARRSVEIAARMSVAIDPECYLGGPRKLRGWLAAIVKQKMTENFARLRVCESGQNGDRHEHVQLQRKSVMESRHLANVLFCASIAILNSDGEPIASDCRAMGRGIETAFGREPCRGPSPGPQARAGQELCSAGPRAFEIFRAGLMMLAPSRRIRGLLRCKALGFWFWLLSRVWRVEWTMVFSPRYSPQGSLAE